MADRSLRGMRLGSQSLQSEEGVEYAMRQRATYQCGDGSTFEVVFAEDAEVPPTWQSPKNGMQGILVGADGSLVDTAAGETKEGRTHWDMLLERRSRDELEEILQERLQILRDRRGGRRSA